MGRRIIFRMDDICPCMNRSRFMRMKELLDSYNAKAVIGVVPECKDPTLNIEEEDPGFWELVLELQKNGWTVAMHGCFHEYTTNKNGYLSNNRKSEFAGLPYNEQYRKLEYGKTKLEQHGITTNVFMAPSHSYDRNTLLALRKLGFQYVTDGLTARPYEHLGLVFIPCIESKIKGAKRLMTVCYHTNMIAEQRFAETEDVLKNHRDEVITFENAYDLPKRPYCISRVEEKLRWIYKYKIIGTVYKLIKG